MKDSSKVRIHAFVSGRVQGVFFRATTKEMADKLGLKGWVRNLPDGRVEVVAEGSKEAIRTLIEFLKRGPPLAKVENIEIREEPYKGEFETFEIIY